MIDRNTARQVSPSSKKTSKAITQIQRQLRFNIYITVHILNCNFTTISKPFMYRYLMKWNTVFFQNFFFSSGAKLLDLTVTGICASMVGARIPKHGKVTKQLSSLNIEGTFTKVWQKNIRSQLDVFEPSGCEAEINRIVKCVKLWLFIHHVILVVCVFYSYAFFVEHIAMCTCNIIKQVTICFKLGLRFGGKLMHFLSPDISIFEIPLTEVWPQTQTQVNHFLLLRPFIDSDNLTNHFLCIGCYLRWGGETTKKYGWHLKTSPLPVKLQHPTQIL